jgi:hypothetical protein
MGNRFVKNIPDYSLQSDPHKYKIQNMYSYLSRTVGTLDSHGGVVDNRISLEELRVSLEELRVSLEELRSITSSYNMSL